jgi:hypothetical protein
MSNIDPKFSFPRYTPIPATGEQLKEFDEGVFVTGNSKGRNFGRALGKNDGVIDAREMQNILHDQEKKEKFLSAIVTEVAQQEKAGNIADANDLKALYFDIVTGKTEGQLEKDAVLFKIMQGDYLKSFLPRFTNML